MDAFYKGIQYAVENLGKLNLARKEQQYQVLGARSDCDFQHTVIIVVFPLNVLMQDQVEKLMAYAMSFFIHPLYF